MLAQIAGSPPSNLDRCPEMERSTVEVNPSQSYLEVKHFLALLPFFLIGLLFTTATGENASGSDNKIRIAYIVPTDREPTLEYEQRIATVIGWIQSYYADQMERHGFGRMTFRFETASDGQGPRVHLVRSSLTANALADTGHIRYEANGYWENSLAAMEAVDLLPWKPGEIWLLFVEAHSQQEDGSIRNWTTQADGKYRSGVALCSAEALAFALPEMMADRRLSWLGAA